MILQELAIVSKFYYSNCKRRDNYTFVIIIIHTYMELFRAEKPSALTDDSDGYNRKIISY